MSCYGWESGTIKIPTSEWSKFRTGVIKAFNDRRDRMWDESVRVFENAKLAKKGKRNFDLISWFENEANDNRSFSFDEVMVIRSKILPRVDGKYKLLRPKKNMFAHLPTSKNCTINCNDGGIVLNNESRTVVWAVSENNHAVEVARSHPVAQKMFRLLDRVKWTRNSGGTIVGNDEYNRDNNDYCGGGGSYVTMEYGPKKKSRNSRF